LETTYKDLFALLKKKDFAPVYLLHGEEAYYIDAIGDYIEQNALAPAERDFNQLVLYGKDAAASEIVGQARRFPVFATKQLIIIKEAQDIKDFENLEIYLQNPLPTTILVFCYKNKPFDKRKKTYTLIKNKGVVMPSEKLRDYQINAWIDAYIKEKNSKIAPDALMLLAEFLGTDLSKITNELDKIWLNQPKTEVITAKIVENYVGISRQFNVFELQNAMGKRDAARSYEIALQIANNPKISNFSLVGTIATLYGYFNKLYAVQHLGAGASSDVVAKTIGLHPFIAKEYVSAAQNYPLGKLYQVFKILLEYDARSKGIMGASASSETALLIEMVVRLLR
jgi:DNA polymerase-3 subunit delta